MSSNSATSTPTVLVKFVDASKKIVKYEYKGKALTTNSLKELVGRAKNAGITVLYTQPVQRYLASLRSASSNSVAPSDTEKVRYNVEKNNFDWTLIKGVGPKTALKLYKAGFTQLSHIGAYELGTDVLESLCTPTQLDAIMHAWEVDRAWTKIGVTIPS